MNKVEGHISGLEVSGSLSLVTVEFPGAVNLKAIVIETPETAPYLVMGHRVRMLFKETEVVLGTGDLESRVSLENQIKGRVEQLEEGALLCRVLIGTAIGELQAVISSRAATRLGLKEGLPVTAMVKLNEIMLSE